MISVVQWKLGVSQGGLWSSTQCDRRALMIGRSPDQCGYLDLCIYTRKANSIECQLVGSLQCQRKFSVKQYEEMRIRARGGRCMPMPRSHVGFIREPDT